MEVNKQGFRLTGSPCRVMVFLLQIGFAGRPLGELNRPFYHVAGILGLNASPAFFSTVS